MAVLARRVALCVLLAGGFLFCSPAMGYELSPRTALYLDPLFHYEKDAEEGKIQFGLLGPLFHFESTPMDREVALRPLFSWKSEKQRSDREVEFLYPLGKYEKKGEQGAFQVGGRLLPFFSARANPPEEDAGRSYFFLFPYFSGTSREGERFWGVFPLYGTMWEWFQQDRIRFYLWPLYSDLMADRTTTRHIVWPLFSYTKGPRESGVQVRPFYGKRERKGELSRSYILWPFYIRVQTDLSSEAPGEFLLLFPFYLKRDIGNAHTRGVLYPFFSWTWNDEATYRETNVLWPLYKRVEGETVEATRIFPLWGRSRRETGSSSFLLWPLYYRSRSSLKEMEREAHHFLLLNRSVRMRWREDGRVGRYVKFWPLFSYQRGREQEVKFSLPSVLPFEDEGFDKHYAPLFRLYGYSLDAQGRLDSQALWGLYRHRKTAQQEGIHLSPLLSWERVENEGAKLSLLQGLFEYQWREDRQRSLRLFYLPWRIRW